MIRSYISLTKPGILLGNTITAAGGFALVSKGKIDLGLLLATLVGLGLIMAAGCVLNNYMDRMADAKMQRTKNRPLARGEIPLNHAFFFGLFLCITGAATLAFFTNLMTLLIALCGFVIYVGIYTLAKYRTHHATLIGSFAGAAPPLVGCTAASFALGPAALLLFSTVALWQMPHFFAIGIYRMHEYEVAQIPILPIKRGLHNTKIQIFFYIIAFMIAAASLTLFGYTGKIFLSASLLLGAAWLLLALIGFKAEKEKLWARRMFLFSLVVITTLSGLLFVDTV